VVTVTNAEVVKTLVTAGFKKSEIRMERQKPYRISGFVVSNIFKGYDNRTRQGAVNTILAQSLGKCNSLISLCLMTPDETT
jgi:hypothetical protein